MRESIVIVGANLAGGRAAEQLRREGFDGQIFLIGEEPSRPYERPPLSKELLWGEACALYLRDEQFYRDNRIELRLSRRAERLDLARERVELAGGEELPATKILLCTGGRVRRLMLEGAELDGVHYVRTLEDAARLRTHMTPGSRLVIIGMGVIGAEVAASAIKLGCEVTAVEPMAAPMMRVFGPHFGRWLAEKHERRGVRVLLRTRVKRLLGSKGELNAVMLEDGLILPADTVVVGIGIEACTELAQAAGIHVENGVTVDRQCRTSAPNVWAAGDVARQPDFFESGAHMRVETFQNAQDQATAAAASMLGKPVEYSSPGWFWTDQHDLNIQLCGRITEDAVRVVRGEESSEQFSAFYLRKGAIEGVLTVNRAQDMGAGKRLVERRVSAAAETLADESVPLRTLLAGGRQQHGQ